MMNLGENSDSIPTDLIYEILSRLPIKSIGRFRCVSDLWRSMLSCPDFTKSFLTMSSARPRILFAVERNGAWSFYSSPQPQNTHEKSALVVATDFHMKFSENMWPEFRGFTSGLIYFSSETVKKDFGRVICNPITGQYAMLPELKRCSDKEYIFLGFDPIDKHYKVLLMCTLPCNVTVHHILTLGTKKVWWRMIQCPLSHTPLCEGICINGVLYYLAIGGRSYVIVCFDVRSEKFKFIDIDIFCNPYATKLVNYKGKLGGIYLKVDDDNVVTKLRMWVLKDVKIHELLKYVYTLPKNEALRWCKFHVAGVTARGEIVFLEYMLYNPFYVVYFNPESEILQRVEIHGNHAIRESRNMVYAYVDYVEDLKFNIMETTYAATSISPLEQNHMRKLTSTNKFDALCLLDDDEFTGEDT